MSQEITKPKCPIEVLNDYVLLRIDIIKETNGIILPDSAQKENQRYEATIANTGEDCSHRLVIGKQVLVQARAAVEVEHEGISYWLVRQANIMGVLNVPANKLN